MALPKNEVELKAYLIPKLRIMTQYLIKQIAERNQDLIDALVYGAYDPVEYERTYQFRDAWREEANASVGGGFVTGHFSFDPSKLTVGANGQHSNIADGAPFQTYLAEVIYEGLSGAIYEKGYAKNSRFAGQEWANKRNAWKLLVNQLGTSQLSKWIKDGCEQAGLDIQWHKLPTIEGKK